MSNTLKTITYSQLFEELLQAKSWLESIGIKVANTRFTKIVDNNELILKHYESNQVSELISNYDNVEMWYSQTEASAFIKVFQAFKDLKSHQIPRAKLKKILEGPFLPWDEASNEANTESRDTLFELECAAIIKNAGGGLYGFDDIDFIFSSWDFNVQCKRFHSQSNIEYNINEASNQFNERMAAKSKLKGILAFSIDKITGKEGLFLEIRTEDEIEDHLNRLLTDFINDYKSIWGKFLNIHLIAIMIVVHIVALIEQEEDKKLLTTCRQIGFDIIPNNNLFQAHDYHLMRELGESIRLNV